jgi:hypothetical protein
MQPCAAKGIQLAYEPFQLPLVIRLGSKGLAVCRRPREPVSVSERRAGSPQGCQAGVSQRRGRWRADPWEARLQQAQPACGIRPFAVGAAPWAVAGVAIRAPGGAEGERASAEPVHGDGALATLCRLQPARQWVYRQLLGRKLARLLARSP